MSASQSQSLLVPDKFHLPFTKVHLAQLTGKLVSGPGWEVSTESTCMVWLQGWVEQVQGEEVLLGDDKGSRVRVGPLSGTPGGSKWVKEGQYIQVIGQYVDWQVGQAGDGVGLVRCSKLADLTHNKQAQQMWDLEVVELHNLLAGRVSFPAL